jgi:hypothetical protein
VTVTTVFAGTGDGHLQSASATYANARDGTGTTTLNPSATTGRVGQFDFGGEIVDQCFFEFDTSGVPNLDTISSVVLALWVDANAIASNFECRVAEFDYGTLAAADFRSGSQLSTLESTALKATTTLTTGLATGAYKSFSDAGGGLASLANLKTGTSRIVVYDFNQVGSGNGALNEGAVTWRMADFAGTTNDPKLTITHAGPSVTGVGGVVIDGSADVAFAVTGVGAVPADVVIEWDLDDDGDFSEDVEDITGYVMALDMMLGRDRPSPLFGKATPGKMRLTLLNSDDRFSYSNGASPLTQAPYSLDVGRKVRWRTSDAAEPQPTLLVRDRFNRADQSGLGTAETGQTWSQPLSADFSVVDSQAKADGTGSGNTTHLAVIDCGSTSYYAQVTVIEPGHNASGLTQQQLGTASLVYRYQDTNNYSLLRINRQANSELMVLELVDVVAGVTTVIETSSTFPARKEVTIGVRVEGSGVFAYLEGVPVISDTAIQTDETEVGIRATFANGNTAPIFDDFHVWSRMAEAQTGILFTGEISDISPTVDLGPYKTVVVTVEGALADLAASSIKPQPEPFAVFSGYAIGEALVKAGKAFPPPRGSTIDGTGYGLSRGNKKVGAYGYGSDGITALEHARMADEVEYGFLHETPEGWVAFHDRNARAAAPVMALFGDDDVQFGYASIELFDRKAEIVNHVKAGISADAPSWVAGNSAGGASNVGVARPINVTLPASGIEDGDLAVIIITSTIDNDNEGWLVPLWWVKARDTGATSSFRQQIFLHICDGTEDGTSVRFYNDSAAAGGSYIYDVSIIRNWYGSHDGIAFNDPVQGLGASGSTPPPMLPPWGVENATLFFAMRQGAVSTSGGGLSGETYPLNYYSVFGAFQNGNANSEDCALQDCLRSGVVDVEAVESGFTGMTGLGNVESSILAIRAFNGDPPEQSGRYLLEFDDVDSQQAVRAIRPYDGPTRFATEADAETWAELILADYATDRQPLRITFPALKSAGYRNQAISRRLGQKIRLVANGETGLGIDGEYHIENIGHRLANGAKEWWVTWELSPA